MTKRLIVLIAASLFISLHGYSQFSPNALTKSAESKVGSGTEQKAKELLDKIKSAANLTPDQEKKILPTLQEYFTKLENIKKNDAGKNTPQSAQQTSQAKESMLDKIKGVVSSDQFTKIKTALAEKLKL